MAVFVLVEVANNGNVGEPDVMDDVRLVKTDAAVTDTDVIILADGDVVVDSVGGGK